MNVYFLDTQKTCSLQTEYNAYSLFCYNIIPNYTNFIDNYSELATTLHYRFFEFFFSSFSHFMQFVVVW